MSDLLDSYLGGPVGGAPDADPLDQLFREQREARQSVQLRQAGNPAQVSRANVIARQENLPPSVVERNLSTFESQKLVAQAVALQRKMAGFDRWSQDERNAASATDDYAAIGKMGDALRRRVQRDEQDFIVGSGFIDRMGDLFRRGIYAMDYGAANMRGVLAEWSANNPLPWTSAASIEADRRDAAQQRAIARITGRAANMGVAGQTTFEDVKARPGLGTVGNFVLEQGVGSLPGMAVAALNAPLYVASQAGSIAATRAEAKGLEAPRMQELAEAAPAAVVSTMLERLGIESIFGAQAKNAALRVLQAGGGEAATEFLQSGVEYLGGRLGTTKGVDYGDMLDQSLAGALAGFGMGGGLRAGGETTHAVIRPATKLVQRFRQADAATHEGLMLDRLGDAAAGSKLRTRDPEAFAGLMRELGADAGIEQVFIPADAIHTYMQSDGYDGAFDSYRDAIDEGLVTGGDVVLPIETVVTQLAGTPGWQALRDDMRLSPGGMSPREAQTFDAAMADVMAELSDQMAERDTAEAGMREPREKLFQAVSDKLMNAGFTPTMARTQAEFLTQRMATRSARMGLDLTGAEFDGIAVNRVLPPALAAAQKVDQVDMTIDVMKRQLDPKKAGGPSLLEYISKGGGIEDPGGDLRAMDAQRWHVGKPGKRKLIRETAADQPALISEGGPGKNSLTPDEWAFRAWEAGYFPEFGEERPGINDLFEAIDAELRGTPRFNEVQDKGLRDAAEELRAMLENAGIDPATASRRDIRAAVDRYVAEQSEWDGFEQSAADKRGWSRAVDAIFRGDKMAAGPVRLGRTPAVLQALGMPSGDMVMQKAKIARARREHPEVPLAVWHDLPDLLSDPRAVVPSRRGDGSVVVAVDAVDRNGDRIIVPVIASEQDGAVVLSVYGKGNGDAFIAGEVAAATKAGDQFYVRTGLADALVAEAPGDAASRAPIAPEVPARPKKAILSRRDLVKKSLDQSGDGPRGRISFPGGYDGRAIIDLFESADQSTFIHETSHLWLEELRFDAADPNAPQQLRDDWQTVQDWFSANGHPIVDGVIPVEAHEMWARAGEQYLMEGKAPSLALRRMFQTFKAWMISVYHTVSRLNVPMTDEIRSVMDRLVATDEELADAIAAQHIEALFPEKPDTMTDGEYAAYREQTDNAVGAARDALLNKVMNGVRRRVTKEYRERAAEVRADVEASIDARPEFRAIRQLRETPLDANWLRDFYGEEALAMLPKQVPPIYRDGGANPDEVAELSGFTSGDEMVRTLMGVETRRRELREGGDQRSVRKALIDQEVDRIMMERYGDPLTDGTIEEEALAAVHSDQQGEVIAAEMRVLARSTGQRVTPYRIAKEWAARAVREGTVNDVASRGAIRRHERAAAKAGKAAMEAVIAGDRAEAFRQKQAQMLNNALVAEARRAADDVDAAVGRLEKWAKRRTVKSVDQDYLERAQALLEQVDMKPRSQRFIDRRDSFEAWAEAQEALGHDIVVPRSFAASLGTTHWSRLTVDQLTALDEAVKQIIHLGRLKQTLLDNKEQRDFEAVVNEALDQIDALVASDDLAERREDRTFVEPGALSRALSVVRSIDASMLKLETVFDWLDGKQFGVFKRMVFQPIVNAQERRRRMTGAIVDALQKAQAKVPKAVRNGWSNKVTLNLIDPRTGNPAVMTRDQLISMALNMGNEGNARKLAGGFGWSEKGMLDTLNAHLTKDEWQYVQDVWDAIETLWPEIEALERRVNGVAPEKVEARAIWVGTGADAILLPGGYYPVVYDGSRDLRVEKQNAIGADDLFTQAYRRANTRAGATNERTEVQDRPILLSPSVLSRHVVEVIHDITHREVLMNAHRFVNDARIVKRVREVVGEDAQKQINPWLHHIANEYAYENQGMGGFEKILKALRVNATFTGLAFRWSTVAMQLSGFVQTAEVIGPTAMAKGVFSYATHPVESFQFVLERSQEVASRMETMDRDMRDMLSNESSLGKTVSDIRASGFMAIGAVDRFVSVVSWISAYNQSLERGAAEDAAIAYADEVIRKSQGSGAAKDMAAIMRGKGAAGEAMKMITPFYSFMSAYYQRQRTFARDTGAAFRKRDAAAIPGLVTRALLLYVFPAIAAEWLAGRWPDDDDEDGFTKWALQTMTINALGPLPVVRDLANVAVKGFDSSVSSVDRFVSTASRVIKDAQRLAEGEETKRATRNTMEVAGYLGAPTSGQMAATTQFLVDVASGDQHPETFGEWWEGLTKGKISD